MVVAKSAEHEIGGLGTKDESRLTRSERRPQLREREPDGGRSCVSQPIRRDDDPLASDAKRRCENGVHPAIRLMWQDVVAGPAPDGLCRRGAMQKQFEAGVVNGGEIMLKFWIPGYEGW